MYSTIASSSGTRRGRLSRYYPQTRVQLCMVHMVRNSLKYVSYKHRKEVAADLKLIYGAATEAEAEVYLDLFTEKWNRQYPSISKL
ncbi:MAG TPA: transposase [Ktedonobacteraceae bacterium]|nr:transposase [Ktedonobacteraceae bacterium]